MNSDFFQNNNKHPEYETGNILETLYGILNNISDVILSTSYPGMDRVIFMSPAAEKLYGYTPDSFKETPKLWFDLIVEDDRSIIEKIVAEIERNGCAENEYRIIRSDGSTRWVNDRRYLVTSGEGKAIRLDGILADITERKLAEERLKKSYTFQKIISLISATFVKTTKESFDDDITTMLSHIGNHFEIDRSYLFLFSGDREFMTNSHEWCREGVPPQKENLQRLSSKKYPWWTGKILAEEHIHITDIEALPREARGVRDLLKQQDIQSLLCIPVTSAGRVWGFLGLDSVSRHYSWDVNGINNLQIAANIFGDFLLKQHTEKELVETKRAVEESEERFRQIAENTGEVFWLRNADNTEMLYINPAYERIWGRTRQSLFDNPMSFIDAVFEHDMPLVIEAFEKYRQTGKFDLEYRIVHSKGNIRWVRAQSFPVKNEKGETISHAGIAVDINENKTYQETLELLTDMAKVFINLPVGQLAAEVDKTLEVMGRFVSADRAYIFDYDWENQVCNNTYEWCADGITPEIDNLQNVPLDLVPWWVDAHKQGKTLFIPDVDALPDNDGVKQILEPQGIKSLMTLPLMNGKDCLGFLGFDSVRDLHQYTEKEEDLLAVFAGILVNIQNRVILENSLVNEREKALASSKAKSEFLANMSHEIRTPMNAILGFSEVLYHKLDDAQHKKMIKSVLKSGNLLMSLLNDILDLSKIESEKIDLSPQAVETINVIDEIKILFQEITEKKGVNISIDVCDNFPNALMLDEIRFKQIIFNLVGNAVKFTHKGYIKIRLCFEYVNDKQGVFTVKVTDTGIGIAEDKQEVIFEAFRQQSGESTRHYEGAGLGLAISKKLAEKMNGSLSVESKEGVGCTFTLEIKNVATCDYAVKTREKFDFDDIVIFDPDTILIVDDVISNIESVESMLMDTGLKTISADNGGMALEILKHTKPALVLLDVRMPGIDGYEVVRRIKNNRDLAHVPVIAYTASVSSQDNREKAENFDGFLYKPVNRSELLTELIKHLPHKRIRKDNESLPNPQGQLLKGVAKMPLEAGSLLEQQFLPQWHEVIDGMVLFKVEEFANRLLDFAGKHDFDYLENYANQALTYVNDIKVDDLRVHLEKFPKIIEAIKQQKQ